MVFYTMSDYILIMRLHMRDDYFYWKYIEKTITMNLSQM